MAEILISLTIIGIIAAITLPSLRANINEKTWATQRKALYSRMSQAISMLPSLNGYGIGISPEETKQNAGMAFVTEGLSNVINVNNICDKNNLKKCGISASFKKFYSRTSEYFPKTLFDMNDYWRRAANPQKAINTDVVAFQTLNGESVAVFYNPYCVSKDLEFAAQNVSGDSVKIYWPYFCASFVYDLNGLKGPNQVGKDIWYMVALYSHDSDIVTIEATKITKSKSINGFNSLKNYCASINARISTLDEFVAFTFFRLLGLNLGVAYDAKTGEIYVLDGNTGGIRNFLGAVTGIYYCIKR